MPASRVRTRRSLFSLMAGLALPFEAVSRVATPWVPGLQLFTVRDLLGDDRDGILRSVAEIGYRAVELAGLAGATAHGMRASLQRYKLSVPSMHASYERLGRNLDAVVEEAHALGAEFLVCPSIDADKRATPDDWKRVSHSLGKIAREVRPHGLSLAYHNHDFEFVPLADGSIPFELVMRETDPRDVKLELDVYWVAKAGLDPPQCLKDSQGRVLLVHLKDLAADGATVELGAGVLNIEQIIRAALFAGVKHLFVEQDSSVDPLASVRASFQFLERLPQDVRPQQRG
jgi:sugar phosphate isomerase/epimerase